MIAATLLEESQSNEARSCVAGQPRAALLVSDFAMAECISAFARHKRMRQINAAEAVSAVAALDAWTTVATTATQLTPEDIAQATVWLRRMDLNLRTPDALHLAAAWRLGARLVTLDLGLAEAAGTLGMGTFR